MIELLVVIAIIAILAAILFPVFAQAREKARQTACLSNTKQIGLALYQYMQDYDETLPIGGFSSAAANYYSRWSDDLQPYLKSRDVFVCPSRPEFKPRNYPGTYTPSPRGAGAYGLNGNLVRFVYDSGGAPVIVSSMALAAIPDTAGTFLAAEAAECNDTVNGSTIVGNQNPDTWDQFQKSNSSYPSDWQVQAPSNYTGTTYYYDTDDADRNNRRRPVPRHSGGLNVIYCDGHAKWSKASAFLGTCATNGNKVGYCYGDPKNSWDDR